MDSPREGIGDFYASNGPFICTISAYKYIVHMLRAMKGNRCDSNWRGF